MAMQKGQVANVTPAATVTVQVGNQQTTVPASTVDTSIQESRAQQLLSNTIPAAGTVSNQRSFDQIRQEEYDAKLAQFEQLKKQEKESQQPVTPGMPEQPQAQVQTAQVPQEDAAYPTDVKALLTKVRKEEKDKAYSEIEKLKKDLEEKEALLKAMVKPETPETPTVPVTPQTPTAPVQTQQNVNQDSSKFEALLQKLESKITDMSKEFDKKLKSIDLETYTKNKLAELDAAGIGYIPELIAGNSEIEIDEAIIRSKTVFTTLLSRLKDDGTIPTQPLQPKYNIVNPAVGQQSQQQEYTAEEIRAIPLDNWGSKRDTVLSQVASRLSKRLR